MGTTKLETWHYRAAALGAIVLLVGSGIGHRVLAWRRADLFSISSFPAGTLEKLPRQIGDWTGGEKPLELDKRVVEILDADDRISRVYARGPAEGVTLWVVMRRSDVAYGVHPRELMPHRPENCYRQLGWTLDSTQSAELEAADGSLLPVEIFRFHRGGIEVERVTVLCYYIMDGQRHSSHRMLRVGGWRPKGSVRYVAQVQITSSNDVPGSPGEELVQAFAVESAPGILALLSDAIGSTQVGDESLH